MRIGEDGLQCTVGLVVGDVDWGGKSTVLSGKDYLFREVRNAHTGGSSPLHAERASGNAEWGGRAHNADRGGSVRSGEKGVWVCYAD